MGDDDFDLQSQLDDNLGSDYNSDLSNNSQQGLDFLGNQTDWNFGNYNQDSINMDNGWDVGPGNTEQWATTGTGDRTMPGANGASGGFINGQGQYNNYGNLGQNFGSGGAQSFLQQLFANPQNITKMLGAVQEMAANKKKANALSAIANQQREQMDPFGAQRAQYQQLLSQTYTNPNVVLGRPEIQAQLEQMKQQMDARDAAAGRRSQYGSRANQLALAAATLVDKYRQQLATLAGANIGPNTNQAAQIAAAGADYNAKGLAPLFNAASNIQQQQTLADLLTKWQR